MAFQNNLHRLTFEANADLSDHKFKIVELMSTGLVQLAALSNGYGVLQNVPEANEAASVAVEGQTKVIAGDTLAIGDFVRAQSGGWAVAVVSGDLVPLTKMGRVLLGVASGGIATIDLDRDVIPSVVSGSIVDGLT